jgi:hypothetical protein
MVCEGTGLIKFYHRNNTCGDPAGVALPAFLIRLIMFAQDNKQHALILFQEPE